jgi:hypothetical protein
MPASSKFEPKRTKLSTQDLPEIPAVQDMITWNKEKVLQWDPAKRPEHSRREMMWITSKSNTSLVEPSWPLVLSSTIEIVGLSLGVSLALQDLVEEVKRGV